MGRYDKFKYRNSANTSWLTPTNVKIRNAANTAWIDLGDNTSYNTKDLNVRNAANTAFFRATLNRQDYTNYNYNTSSSFFPRMAESTATTLTNGEYTATVNIQYTGWNTYWQDSFDGDNANYGYVFSSVNTNDLYMEADLTWTTPRWIDKIQLYSANTTNWAGVPKRFEIWIRYAGDPTFYWTKYIYPSTAYTAAAQARDWDINIKDPRGITGIKLKAQNNDTWKTGSYSLRFGELYLYGGTVTTTTGTNWI